MEDFSQLNWTSSDRAKQNCATVTMEGCRLDGNALYQTIEDIKAGSAKSASNMYKCSGGGGHFIFPFFNTTYNSFSNEFADTYSQVSQRGVEQAGGDMLQGAWDMIQSGKSLFHEFKNIQRTNFYTNNSGSGATGSYQETPKFYQMANTSDPLQVSFVLSNAGGTAGANLKAINDFTKACKPEWAGGISYKPPMVFKGLQIAGHRRMDWAYCSTFSVGMLGMRTGQDPAKPEGYECNFGFTSLTIESANIVPG